MKKKSALIISISMVLVTVLALTTASFAWFSASMNPSLGGFDVNVTTSNALLIGVRKNDVAGTAAQDVTDIEYKTELSLDDLKLGYLGLKNTVFGDEKKNELLQTANDVLRDVTPTALNATSKNIEVDATANSILFSKIKDRAKEPNFATDYEVATNNGADKIEVGGVEKSEKDFLVLDFYVKANFASGGNILFNLDLTSKAADNTTYAGSEFYAVRPTVADANVKERIPFADKDTNKTYWLTTALRTAFTTQKVVGADGVKIAAPATPKLGLGGEALELDDRAPLTIAAANKIDTDKAYTKKSITVDPLTGKYTNTADLEIAELENGCVYRITAYLWIEGNDLQCYNDITGSEFHSNIKFSAVQKPVVTP